MVDLLKRRFGADLLVQLDLECFLIAHEGLFDALQVLLGTLIKVFFFFNVRGENYLSLRLLVKHPSDRLELGGEVEGLQEIRLIEHDVVALICFEVSLLQELHGDPWCRYDNLRL